MVAHRAELTEQITADAVQSARQVTAEELTAVVAPQQLGVCAIGANGDRLC